ncbi:hypothetical protein JCM10212_006943 [Sporobolomyces blumeae]
MNSRKSAKAIPSTLNRFLESRSLLKSPPPAFYPLAAHPPPPSLVRSFPTRHNQDLPRKHQREPQDAARHNLNHGLRPSSRLAPPPPPAVPATRRKPPRKANTKHSRPLPIVFPEDRIRERFYRDHPFEAYRPVSLVESDKVRDDAGLASGSEWSELRQRSLNPSAEDCISFIHNLTASHGLPLAQAYPLGIAQFRTLRAEHETATLSARLEAEAFGAVLFGEIERGVTVEEKVLDEWVRAKEIQDAFAVQGGPGASAAASTSSQVATTTGVWSPAEALPASFASSSSSAAGRRGVVELSSEFSGGQEYLKAFRAKGSANQGAAVQKTQDGLLVGVEGV